MHIYVQFTSKTYLYYTKNEKNEKLLSMCPELANPNYKPHFLFPFAFQQMFLSLNNLLIQDKPKLKFREQKVNKYGLTLFWPFFSDFEEISDPNTPILFFLPGMTGEISDPYVINICIEGLKNGYHVCMYQMRILNENFGVDETRRMSFCEDIDLCLDVIKKQFNKAKIYAISGSFGDNNLLYYLGEKNKNFPKEQKKIEAAVSFSNPYNMEMCSRLCEGRPYLIRKGSGEDDRRHIDRDTGKRVSHQGLVQRSGVHEGTSLNSVNCIIFYNCYTTWYCYFF